MAQIIREGEISSDKLVRFSTEQLTLFPQKQGVTILGQAAQETASTWPGQQPGVGGESRCTGSMTKQSSLQRTALFVVGYLQQTCHCLLVFFFCLFQIMQLPSADNIYLCAKVNPLIRKLQFLCALKFPVNRRLRSQPTFLLLLDRN